MAQPYDYSLNVPSPMQAFNQAFKVGADQRIVLEQAAAREQAAKMQEEGNRLAMEYFETPADQRSYDQILQISMFNKPFADMAQKSFDMLSVTSHSQIWHKNHLICFLNNSSRVLLQTPRRFILHYEMCWQVKLTLKFLIKFWIEGFRPQKAIPD
jgi:hypothetical protein